MRLILSTLLSHYRRAPWQLVFLAVGVILAVSLFVGVHAINELARQSYQEGEQLLGQQPTHFVEPASASVTIPQDFYVALRLKGIRSAAPMIRGRVALIDQQWIRVIGVDPLSWPEGSYQTDEPADEGRPASSDELRQFILPPYQLRVSPKFARQLGWSEGFRPRLADGRELPAVKITRASIEQLVMMDIGFAQQLLDKPDQLTAIALFGPTAEQLRDIRDQLPPQVLLRPAADQLQLEQLTGSFHMNLTALGLLAFVVGLFLVYSAVNYTLSQRQLLVCRLRVLGISANQLAVALLLELTLLVCLFALPGIALGLLLAQQLAPSVTQTLSDLYSLILATADSSYSRLTLLTLVLILLGCWIACAWPLLTLSRTPPLWAEQRYRLSQQGQRRDRWLLLFALCLALLSLGLWLWWQTLAGAFVIIAMLLLAAALALPFCVHLILGVLSRLLPARWQTAQWLVADLRAGLGVTAVVLMALLVALAANSGINTMIGSFRGAVVSWIDQRLESDIYVRGEGIERMRNGLATELFPDLQVIRRYQRDLHHAERGPWSVTSLSPGELGRQSLPLRTLDPMGWERFERGEGVFINERLFLLGGVKPGQLIDLPGTHRTLILPVVGVFYDYGNLFDQVMVTESLFVDVWPDTPVAGLGLITAALSDPDAVERWLLETLKLSSRDVANRTAIRDLVMAVFDRTFDITRALNALTLLVAAIGLFCSLAMLERNRSRQLALICCLGISRRQLIGSSLLQWGLLGVLVAVIAIPYGILLTWLLIDLVNVRAFGWSMPLQIDWRDWVQLPLLGAGVALLAGLLPAIRLLRLPVSRLMREAL